MNLTQEKALFHLTGKRDLTDLNVDSWQQLSGKHPYFTPAQFFLASKLKQEENSLSAGQLLKTNLYFTNPYWLQFQLQYGLKNKKDKTESVALPPAFYTHVKEKDTGIQEPETGNKIANLLSGQLAEFKKPVDADAKLDIETIEARLHTIDYFASQGIKIDLSKIPQDKLTTNLRKFTDWLKQMKNANVSDNDLGGNLELEKAVMETAKLSNEAREILTETMADVLAKQGQVDKAIQLYIKLSFLNPEKSSYFAAKIEQLKGI
jgi:hypothetical protein